MGGVYALIGIGLTIIFGVMQVINFAHGDLVMVGHVRHLAPLLHWGIDPFLSIVLTAPLLFLLGRRSCRRRHQPGARARSRRTRSCSPSASAW